MSDIAIYNDYYPGGMLLPNRHASSSNYRYGFNGMEKDNELKGEGNSYDFGARMLDVRVNRWFSLDPKQRKHSFESNYSYVSGNPIIYTDPDGERKRKAYVITDESTGKRTVHYVTISEELVSKRRNLGSKSMGLETHSDSYDYSWHDITVIQNITLHKDGSVSVSSEETLTNPKALTSTLENGSWSEGVARTFIGFMGIFSEGNGDDWDGGGVDFFSKKGEGSGVKVKDKNKVDYVNGDDLIASIKQAKTLGTKIDKKALQSIFKALKHKKFSTSTAKNGAKIVKQVKKIFTYFKKVNEENQFLNKTLDSTMIGGDWYPLPDDGKLDGGEGGNQNNLGVQMRDVQTEGN